MIELTPGKVIEVYANQGMRPATILAIHEDDALVEYEMPNGTSVLRIVPRKFEDPYCGKRVAHMGVPTYWLEIMVAEEAEWIGNPQQRGGVKVPQPKELLESRKNPR